MPSADTPGLRSLVHDYEGRTAIFREQHLIFPCRVESATADDWGVWISLAPIRADGFVHPRESSLEVSASWDWGSIGPTRWSGGQGGAWSLHFDAALIDALHEVARACADRTLEERNRVLTDALQDRIL